MLIGQAPGARSEATGRPFAGPSGRVLAAWLDQAGFAPGYFPDRVYCTSLTRCFPGPNPSGSGDRPPGPDERALCREWLDAELAIVRPPVVLLVGRMAIEACYPVGRVGALSAVVGTSATGSGTLYLPLPHPSGASRWLNTPANRLLVDRALAELSAARVRLGL
jgi:uracil-DNA glycosylase